MPEFKIYRNNHLRRHKKDKNNRKFTYVSVNLIFFLASGKRELESKQINKHLESFVCIETLFFSQELHHKVKPAGARTRYCTLNKVSELG